MTDAALTTRYAAAELVEKLLNEIDIPLTSTNSYNVDNGAKWIGGVENRFKELYVPGGSANNDGALQLLNTGSDLANIKSTDMHSATSILYHDMAIADPANTTNTPEITTRADAQEEAERLNTRVQFITGVKEALAKIVTAKFGKRITDPVLRTADGSDFKSINDWTAEDLLEAIRQGADRPTADDTHAKALTIFNFQFNFQAKIQQNYDLLNAKAGQLKNLGIIISPSLRGFLLFCQVEKASTYEWGRDLRPAIQTIRQKYPYNHAHDDVSIGEMLQLFAGADAVRNLSEAPAALTESALAVDLVSQLLNERAVYSDDDSIEQASAVSADSRRSSRKKTDKDDGRDRRDRGRSSSRYRDRSRRRDRSHSASLECKHCQKNDVKCRHYGISEDKCFYNPKRKGWRPERVCRRLRINYVEKKHFEGKDDKE